MQFIKVSPDISLSGETTVIKTLQVEGRAVGSQQPDAANGCQRLGQIPGRCTALASVATTRKY
jgi:hypothetical protein